MTGCECLCVCCYVLTRVFWVVSRCFPPVHYKFTITCEYVELVYQYERQIVSVSWCVVVPVVLDWVSVPHKGAGLLSTSLLLSVSFSISCFLSGCGCRWSSGVIFVLLSLLVDKCNPLLAFRLQEGNEIRTTCVRYHDEDEKTNSIWICGSFYGFFDKNHILSKNCVLNHP